MDRWLALAGCSLGVGLAACGGGSSHNGRAQLVSASSFSACLEQAGLHVVDGGPPAHNNESAAPASFHNAAASTAIDELYIYVALPSAGEPPDTTVELFANPQAASAAQAGGGGSGYTLSSVDNITWSEGPVDPARIGGDVRRCAR